MLRSRQVRSFACTQLLIYSPGQFNVRFGLTKGDTVTYLIKFVLSPDEDVSSEFDSSRLFNGVVLEREIEL